MNGMIDREKVIKGLERCLICDISVVATEEAQNAYRECEYTVGLYCGQKKLLRDAIAMLKEQEAVEPTWSRGKPFCSACGLRIHGGKFCSECGKPIVWEGR